MSAFVVHDLKTVNAQLSLLLRNAERHRTNTVFIDDMLKTVDNAVNRMTKLTDQLRAKDKTSATVDVDLVSLIDQVIHDRAEQRPAPVLENSIAPVTIRADRERLSAVLSHVVQNGQDATAEDGTVRVRVDITSVWAIVTVTDTGHGMAPEFIDNELFAPFATTKGVAGIGIGAYQCREYVRTLGGDVSVRSQTAVGTEFTLRLPLATSRNAEVVA